MAVERDAEVPICGRQASHPANWQNALFVRRSPATLISTSFVRVADDPRRNGTPASRAFRVKSAGCVTLRVAHRPAGAGASESNLGATTRSVRPGTAVKLAN